MGNEQITHLGFVHFLVSWKNVDNSKDVLCYKKRNGVMEDLACLAAPESSCPTKLHTPNSQEECQDLRPSEGMADVQTPPI